MEQTAIDFYHDALLELERKWQTKEIVTFSQWRDMYINAYKQAKEMEKEHIINAFYSHASAMSHDDLPAGESYYNKTFKKQEL
jgi:hypothetical protein